MKNEQFILLFSIITLIILLLYLTNNNMYNIINNMYNNMYNIIENFYLEGFKNPLNTYSTNPVNLDPNSYLINNKYGPTYYKDPKLMTEKQQHKFINSAKFSNMTIGDYVNYLLLSEKLGKQLSLHDISVLAKYKINSNLTLNDIPNDVSAVPPPPMNAQHLYEKFHHL